MTLKLDLPVDLEQRLKTEAARRNQAADQLAIQVLDQHLPPVGRHAAAIALLQQWSAEDEAMTDEECAQNAAVLRALDDDRPSNRKLFPDLLRDEYEPRDSA
jgi:hypothetical protein